LNRFILGPPETYNITYNVPAENHQVTFTCTFDADPLPTISWRLANGSDLPSTNQFEVLVNLKKPQKRFIFNPVLHRWGGIYASCCFL